MQSENRILDDFARLATGALGTFQGAKKEMEEMLKAQLQRLLGDMDLVSREEFDVVRDMAAAAREENIRLSERIDALEEEVASLRKGRRATSATGKARAAAPRRSASGKRSTKTAEDKQG